MKFQPKIPFSNGKWRTGYTLIELLISIAISVFVVASIAILAIITAQNFVATSNYVQMNDQSRNALDRISREIRNAGGLVDYKNNGNTPYLKFTNAIPGVAPSTSTITYYKNARKLVLSKTGQPDETLLMGCDDFDFDLFNRVPLIANSDLTFYPSTGKIDCKVINLNWKCSRTILGSKLNTEVVQTAQVMLRNKVN